MTKSEKKRALDYFQSNSFKTYQTLGFTHDNSNLVFSIIIWMRNMANAADKEEFINLHIAMGIMASTIANYATVNDIKLSDILIDETHLEMEEMTEKKDLEYFLEKMIDELAFRGEMNEATKILFIKKCWVCTFPDNYHDDFGKIETMMVAQIEDLKIKHPQSFK